MANAKRLVAFLKVHANARVTRIKKWRQCRSGRRYETRTHRKPEPEAVAIEAYINYLWARR